jgi:hypothetical protein
MDGGCILSEGEEDEAEVAGTHFFHVLVTVG